MSSESTTQSLSTEGSPIRDVDMTEVIKKCEALGLKPKTEKFGECVLRLSK